MSSEKASSNVAGSIHPHTMSILKTMEVAEEKMRAGDRAAAMEALTAALGKVKPADRPEELEAEINRERALLAQLLPTPTERNKRMRVNVTYYEELTGEAWALLWEKGYLSGDAYKVVTPTAMDNKSGAVKGPPLPAIMSSRLEKKPP